MTDPSGDPAVAEVVVVDQAAQKLPRIVSNAQADPQSGSAAGQLVDLAFYANDSQRNRALTELYRAFFGALKELTCLLSVPSEEVSAALEPAVDVTAAAI
jgi:hypothetical protein